MTATDAVRFNLLASLLPGQELQLTFKNDAPSDAVTPLLEILEYGCMTTPDHLRLLNILGLGWDGAEAPHRVIRLRPTRDYFDWYYLQENDGVEEGHGPVWFENSLRDYVASLAIIPTG